MRSINRLSTVRPSTRAAVVAVAAIASGLIAHQLTADVAAARDRLGTVVVVAVLTTDVMAGVPLGNDDVHLVDIPAALVPDDAIHQLPVGSALRVDGSAREVLRRHRLVGGRSGPASRIPDGWRGVAIPRVGSGLPVEPGDLVDVVASFDAAFFDLDGVGGMTGASRVVATAAVVIHISDEVVTVAVPEDLATVVSDANANAVVTLILLG